MDNKPGILGEQANSELSFNTLWRKSTASKVISDHMGSRMMIVGAEKDGKCGEGEKRPELCIQRLNKCRILYIISYKRKRRTDKRTIIRLSRHDVTISRGKCKIEETETSSSNNVEGWPK